MPAFKDRTGETKKMNCGMNATITEYVNSHCITIRFEDGTVVSNRFYGDFSKGKIDNPKLVEDYSDRIGKKQKMNCGMYATITAYRKSNDIDVQFDDGACVSNRLYQDFLRGEIIHPDLKKDMTIYIGQTKMMHCGMNATIVEYKSSCDIDVRFDDGIIVHQKSLSAFKGGRILHPKFKIVNTSNTDDITSPKIGRFVIGETRMMNCGLRAEIIAYRSSRDIDIKFEDGEVVTNKSYGNFCKSKIEHPFYRASASYPERVISGYLKASKVKFCTEWSDPTLRGESKKKPLYFDFAVFDDSNKLILLIEYQGYQHYQEVAMFGGANSFTRLQQHDNQKKEYSDCHQIPLLYIPPSNNSLDQIVTFLNVFFTENNLLPDRCILPVSAKSVSIVDLPVERVGETKTMRCGIDAQIISYRSSSDIDVQFSDGSIVYHKSYRQFCLCQIVPEHLKYKNRIAKSRTGETKIMKNGMEAKIIRYKNASDVDIQFQDGTIREKQTYSNFKNGNIGNLKCTK